MAIIESIDGPNRLIYLHADTVNAEVDPMDIYREMRQFRRLNEDLRKYDVFMEASGNISKGGGKSTPKLTTLLDGTRIVPYDANSYLTITGEIITDDAQSGIDCFNRTGLINRVDINYIPPQVEIIYVEIVDPVWAEADRDEVLQYSRKASDNAEQANLKL